MTVIVAATVVLASIMPSLWFEHSAALLYSKFDGYISGPITPDALQIIKQSLGQNKYAMANLGNSDIISRSKKITDVNIFFYDRASDLDLTWYNRALLIDGRQPSDGEWAVDWKVARALHIKTGDYVTLEEELSTGIKYRKSGVVVGIYAPTKETALSVISPMNEPIRQDFQKRSGGVLYSHLFFKTENMSRLSQALSSNNLFKDLMLLGRSEGVFKSKQYLDQAINPFMRTGATVVAIAVYLFFILREQWVRIERRQKNMAIFVAIGIQRWQVHALNLIEQIFVAGFTTIAGLSMGRHLMENIWGQYLPAQISVQLVLIIVVLNALVFVLSALQIALKVHYLPVAKLLTQE